MESNFHDYSMRNLLNRLVVLAWAGWRSWQRWARTNPWILGTSSSQTSTHPMKCQSLRSAFGCRLPWCNSFGFPQPWKGWGCDVKYVSCGFRPTKKPKRKNRTKVDHPSQQTPARIFEFFDGFPDVFGFFLMAFWPSGYIWQIWGSAGLAAFTQGESPPRAGCKSSWIGDYSNQRQ